MIACIVVALAFGAHEIVEHTLSRGGMRDETSNLLNILRGMTAAVMVAALAASQLFWRERRVAGPEIADAVPSVDHEERKRTYAGWFIRMRWLAAAFTLALAVVVVTTEILEPDALPLLALWWVALVAANVVFTRWFRAGRSSTDQLMLTQVIVDLIILTGLLNASGGIENPLSIAYLFHVIIAGILLPKRKVALVTAAAGALFVALALGELLQVFPHYTLAIVPHEHIGRADGIAGHAAGNVVFVAGHGLPFLGVLFLTAYFTIIVIERLRESEDQLERTAARSMLERLRLESVIESSGVAMFVVDRERRLQWSNHRAGGWLPGEATVGSELPHTHERTWCLACLADRVFVNGERCDGEFKTDGEETHFFHHTASPVRGSGGQLLQAVHLIQEITKQKELEIEALHAGKLAVLGQMAAGIAHEIDNPLSSLKTRLHLMRTRSTDVDYVERSIELLDEQIDRIGRTVRGVSRFSRMQQDDWCRCSINAVVAEAVKLIRLEPRARHITVREIFDSTAPHILGVKDHVLQVLLNVLLNAVEAMPGGGTVAIETARQGARVAVIVTDDGPGMDATVQHRVFNAFYTTKADGTGLGLSICQTLIQAHGGWITVASEPGHGACFTITLPVCDRFEPSNVLEEVAP